MYKNDYLAWGERGRPCMLTKASISYIFKHLMIYKTIFPSTEKGVCIFFAANV